MVIPLVGVPVFSVVIFAVKFFLPLRGAVAVVPNGAENDGGARSV